MYFYLNELLKWHQETAAVADKRLDRIVNGIQRFRAQIREEDRPVYRTAKGKLRRQCQCGICGQYLSCENGPFCSCIIFLQDKYDIVMGQWNIHPCYECWDAAQDLKAWL